MIFPILFASAFFIVKNYSCLVQVPFLWTNFSQLTLSLFADHVASLQSLLLALDCLLLLYNFLDELCSNPGIQLRSL